MKASLAGQGNVHVSCFISYIARGNGQDTMTAVIKNSGAHARHSIYNRP